VLLRVGGAVDTTLDLFRADLVADRLRGKPLSGDFGNLRIANEGEGAFSRWVRQVVAIEVRFAD
jgi:hypothetical protein